MPPRVTSADPKKTYKVPGPPRRPAPFRFCHPQRRAPRNRLAKPGRGPATADAGVVLLRRVVLRRRGLFRAHRPCLFFFEMNNEMMLE